MRMVEKETGGSTGNNCIKEKKVKIVFAEDGQKSVEGAHRGHHKLKESMG